MALAEEYFTGFRHKIYKGDRFYEEFLGEKGVNFIEYLFYFTLTYL